MSQTDRFVEIDLFQKLTSKPTVETIWDFLPLFLDYLACYNQWNY